MPRATPPRSSSSSLLATLSALFVALVVLILPGLLPACGSTQPNARVPAAQAAPVGASRPALFVLSDGHARILNTLGEAVSSSPLEAPLGPTFFAPQRRQIVLYDASRGALLRLDLDAQQAIELARLGPSVGTECRAEGLEGFDLRHSESGVSRDGQALCLRMADAPYDDATEQSVSLRVPLSGGPVQAAFHDATAEDEGLCPAAPDWTCQMDPAARRWRGELPEGATLETETCTFTTARGARVRYERAGPSCEDTESLGATAGARYAVLASLFEMGDYQHFRLWAVDLSEGVLVPGISLEFTPYDRIAWSPDRRSLLVGETLVAFGETPRQLQLNESAVYIER